MDEIRSTFHPADPIKGLLSYLEASPTPFHAVAHSLSLLQERGFLPLQDDLRPGQGYYAATEGTLIAFQIPDLPKSEWAQPRPLHLWVAHTDSPALKVKPLPLIVKNNHLQIGVEVYGGAILNTWLDRPLAIAGKVFTAGNETPQEHLLCLPHPQVVIPNAAIHLNRNINKGFALLPDTHLPALFSGGNKKEEDWVAALAHAVGIQGKILSHDLFLYDPQPPVLLGEGLLNASRLDNLAMVHAGMSGFLEAGKSTPFISAVAFFNHEEIGSMSYEGAASGRLMAEVELLYERLNALKTLSSRITLSREDSFIISADMAHGFHPSYETWYEGQHRPVLNGGPVIKHNASHRYASTAYSTARMKYFLDRAGLPCQEYLHHAEIPCGSTVGPMVSSRLAIPAVDIGNPLWAMHSIRETAGAEDHRMMVRLAKTFFGGEKP